MLVLAVDTTTPRGSVALLEDEELLGEARFVSAEGHSRHLLPVIRFTLETLGRVPGDVQGFAVTTGPGSFTGLRVGLSTVQGLALASARPCLGVPALDALAARIRGTAETLVAMVDAYRDEVFGALFDRQATLRGARVVEPPEVFLERVPPGAAFIGDGATRHRATIEAIRRDGLFPERSLFLAGTVARLAAPRLAAGEGVPPEALRPLYLREAHIRPSRP